MERLRVASLQYVVRPVSSFDQFRAQVDGLVDTATDYDCQLLVFPEYFTVQLLTLGDVRCPIDEQIRRLAVERERFVSLMSDAARRTGLYVVAGTIPVLDGDRGTVHNRSFFCSPRGEVGVQGKLKVIGACSRATRSESSRRTSAGGDGTAAVIDSEGGPA